MSTPRRDRGHLADDLGTALTTARQAAGQTRAALAKAAGQAANSLRDLEMGLGNPTLTKIETVADLYGVDVTITLTPRGLVTDEVAARRNRRQHRKAPTT